MSYSILSQGKGERKGGRSITPYTRRRARSTLGKGHVDTAANPQKKQSRCRGTERQKIIDRERIILAGPSTLVPGLVSVKKAVVERKNEAIPNGSR